MMKKTDKIFVAGHSGLVGSALVRALREEGYENLLLRTHRELNLCDRQATQQFFDEERPEYVFLSAAKVGGIIANNLKPAEFIVQNLTIELNVIDAAFKSDVKKLLFLGLIAHTPSLLVNRLKNRVYCLVALRKRIGLMPLRR